MARRSTAKLPCGCVYYTDRDEWAKMCPADEAEFLERHGRAQDDFQRGRAPFSAASRPQQPPAAGQSQPRAAAPSCSEEESCRN